MLLEEGTSKKWSILLFFWLSLYDFHPITNALNFATSFLKTKVSPIYYFNMHNNFALCLQILCIHLKRVSVNIFGELVKLQVYTILLILGRFSSLAFTFLVRHEYLYH